MPWWRIVKAARWWLIRKAIFHFYHGIINVISDDRFANYLLLSHFNVTLEQEEDKLCYSTSKELPVKFCWVYIFNKPFYKCKEKWKKKWEVVILSFIRAETVLILNSQTLVFARERRGGLRSWQVFFLKRDKKEFQNFFFNKKCESFKRFRRKPWNKKLPEGPHFESRLAKRTNFLLDLKKSKFCTSF